MEKVENRKMDRDEVLVKLVEQESIIWKRNHLQFKNITMKEQAWNRVAFQLGITTTEAERRFKSIREKYRRRKILLERDVSNNVDNSKLKRWDLYNKLSFLDDFMIPRNGNESIGMLNFKSEFISSENISSTNEVSTLPVPNHKILSMTAKNGHYQQQTISNATLQSTMRQSIGEVNHSRSSQSTPSPSTTTNIPTTDSHDVVHLNPIIKMEVPDESDNDTCVEPETKTLEIGNFNYVGDYISAELNKLPLRDAFVLKNILIREVLKFTEKVVLANEKQ